LTSFQSGKALDSGQVQATGALTLPLASSAVAGVIDLGDAALQSAQAAADLGDPIDEEDQRELVTSALAIALFQPAVVPELAARVGIGFDVDLGLRFNGQLVKGDAKLTLPVDLGEGGALGVSAGLGHHLGIGSSSLETFFDVLGFVELGDFSRQDLDLGLIASKNFGDTLIVYGSLRYIVSFISLDANIEDVETISGIDIVEVENNLHHIGATGGLFLGYKYVFLNLELTVVQVFFKPEILGEEQDLDGLIVAPSLGLTIRI